MILFKKLGQKEIIYFPAKPHVSFGMKLVILLYLRCAMSLRTSIDHLGRSTISNEKCVKFLLIGIAEPANQSAKGIDS